MKTALPIVILFACAGAGSVYADEGDELRFARIIGDDMVLQQGKPIVAWGWAKPGATVEVTLTQDAEMGEKAAAESTGSSHGPVAEQLIRQKVRAIRRQQAESRDLDKLLEKAWKAFDLEIEGVSMVKSYRSQYRDFLRESSFKQLLAKMREKIGKARQKDSRFGKKPEKTKKKEKSN